MQHDASDEKIFEKPALRASSPRTTGERAECVRCSSSGARPVRVCRVSSCSARSAVTRHVCRRCTSLRRSRQQAMPARLGRGAGTATSRARGYGGVATRRAAVLSVVPAARHGARVAARRRARARGRHRRERQPRSLLGVRAVSCSHCAERGDDETSPRRAVWLVYLLPPAYVLVMGYAEAMFMTAAVVVLCSALRSGAGGSRRAAGLLAGLTRPSACCSRSPHLVEAMRTVAIGAARRRRVARAGRRHVGVSSRGPQHLTPRLPVSAARAAGPGAARATGSIRSARSATPTRELFHGDHVSAGIHVVSRARARVAARRAVPAGGRCRSRCTPTAALVVALEQPQPRLARALRTRDGAVRACRRRCRPQRRRDRTGRARPRGRRAGRARRFLRSPGSWCREARVQASRCCSIVRRRVRRARGVRRRPRSRGRARSRVADGAAFGTRRASARSATRSSTTPRRTTSRTGHGFNEPLWTVTHPGRRRRPRPTTRRSP